MSAPAKKALPLKGSAAAVDAWGDELPDWVAAIAAEADRTSEKEAASRMGYSPMVIYEVIRRRYGGSYANVEDAARASIMRAVIECPVLGAIDGSSCIKHQKAPYSSANPLRIQLFRACRHGCPHSSIQGGGK